jgi:hypothetical protein
MRSRTRALWHHAVTRRADDKSLAVQWHDSWLDNGWRSSIAIATAARNVARYRLMRPSAIRSDIDARQIGNLRADLVDELDASGFEDVAMRTRGR